MAVSACSSDDAKSKGGGSSSDDAGRDATAEGGAAPEAGKPDSGPPEAAPPEAAALHVTPAPEGAPYKTLAEWHLFTDPKTQEPSDRVVPFDVIAPLFSDYAAKRRFLYVPEGRKIVYQATKKWDLPVGAIFVKTFSYLADARDPSKGERLLETRLLIHESGGWTPHTYVWDEAQTHATLKPVGTILPAHFIDPSGTVQDSNYIVPTENECRACHGKEGVTNTLGGRTRQLDRDHDYGDGLENQIDHFAKLGFFESPPEAADARQRLVDPFGTAPVFTRVRSYVDANCAHCHQPGDAPGTLSGFWLDYDSTETEEPVRWGVCKQPTSAGGATCGRALDVVPGKPDDSIILCRLESTDPRVRMPPLGRTIVHAEGVALIREWITGLPGGCAGSGEPDAGDAAVPDAAAPDAGDGG